MNANANRYAVLRAASGDYLTALKRSPGCAPACEYVDTLDRAEILSLHYAKRLTGSFQKAGLDIHLEEI